MFCVVLLLSKIKFKSYWIFKEKKKKFNGNYTLLGNLGLGKGVLQFWYQSAPGFVLELILAVAPVNT